ncbi:DUF6171 family protein [Paenibacillus alkalitolerans]|uniref:DUF6171 family protein n=1 Tax=Paenibacillus alkalitolerans TaxID=2799335 RepID=UPI001F4736EB|nr:DUF6171 family protein [Paenibacillus alkalitolerans]
MSCKGCSETYKVTDSQISRILSSSMFQSEQHCVPDDIYDQRLQACMTCPSLQFGTTCSVCGCIVQIRAKLKDRDCPKPGENRWLHHMER